MSRDAKFKIDKFTGLVKIILGETSLSDCPICYHTGTCAFCEGKGREGIEFCFKCYGTGQCLCKTQTSVIESIVEDGKIFSAILSGVEDASNCPICEGQYDCGFCQDFTQEDQKHCPVCLGTTRCLCIIKNLYEIDQKNIFNSILFLKFTLMADERFHRDIHDPFVLNNIRLRNKKYYEYGKKILKAEQESTVLSILNKIFKEGKKVKQKENKQSVTYMIHKLLKIKFLNFGRNGD